MLTVEFSNRQTSLPCDTERWRQVLRQLLASEGIQRGEVSISIVHDAEIHELNRAYLNHDYATDVLSFVLDRDEEALLGEIIVSADTAIERCDEFGWQASQELTLYLIHGALHLVGYDDKSPTQREQMRAREQLYLERFGINAPLSNPQSTASEDGTPSPFSPTTKGSGG